MKKKIALILIVLLLSSQNTFAFSDLGSNHTYNEAINFIREKDIVQGYPDGTFKPDNRITRAELLKIIIESKFSDDEINSALNDYHEKNYEYVDLQDVSIDSWYGPYVRIAIREGIIKGYQDGKFKPYQNVNFVESLKIVLKTYNIDYDANTEPWYKGLIEKGAELNLNPLDITAFDLNITRAQMADLITRVIKYQEGTLENYLINALSIKQTYLDIQSGKNNIENFINRNQGQKGQSNIIDCGKYVYSEETLDNNPNLDCFIEAAKECTPAKIISELEIDFFGMLIKTESYREIKGWDVDKCTIYNFTNDQKINFSEATLQSAIESGISKEEIDKQLAISNEYAKSIIGEDYTCKYPIEDILNILNDEKEGVFSSSSDDIEKYQCTGSLLE